MELIDEVRYDCGKRWPIGRFRYLTYLGIEMDHVSDGVYLSYAHRRKHYLHVVT